MQRGVHVFLMAMVLGCGARAVGGDERLALTRLGMTIAAPAGSTVSDGLRGGVVVQAGALGIVVEPARDDRPTSADEAAREAEMWNPRGQRSEALADGFVYLFEHSSDLGEHHVVYVRRTVGGKPTWCEATAADSGQQAAALAACNSLAPG